MEKEKRLKGNEIIARYAGKSFPSSHISDYRNELPENMNRRYLKYHRLWDELVPVVKKLKLDLWLANTNPTEKANRRLLKAWNEMEIVSIWEEVVKGIQVLQLTNKTEE